MNKAELIEKVAYQCRMTKKDTALVLSALTDEITKALSQGEKVQLVGFGTFEVKERPEREGRNPATGATIKIAAAKRPVFTAGKALRDKVN